MSTEYTSYLMYGIEAEQSVIDALNLTDEEFDDLYNGYSDFYMVSDNFSNRIIVGKIIESIYQRTSEFHDVTDKINFDLFETIKLIETINQKLKTNFKAEDLKLYFFEMGF